MNIIEWMIENKIANNQIQANNIFVGLQLDKLQDF